MKRESNGTAVKKRKSLKKALFGILAIAAVTAGYKGYIYSVTPSEYMIKSKNYFDYQKHYECSGYASAYALRSLGEDVNGLELYRSFPNKKADGTVAALFLPKNLKTAGYKSSLLFGNISDLKYHVSRGVPVIALIRLNNYQPYLHYVPVVGYDNEYIYIADSLSYMVNSDNESYNRKVPIEEFKELWKTDAFIINNIYLTVNK